MRLVAGRYAISAELGRGGMGVVWRGEDQFLGRPVALKELATPPGASPTHLERVLREARTAGRLNHPGVVTVYDVVSEHGATFIVMELVIAPTLADVVGREGPLGNDRVAALGLQVLSALESAHAAGIVHRDVKPSNIMVRPGDRVKLADFGIARATDDPGLTQTGGIMGSPGYMPPELFMRQPARHRRPISGRSARRCSTPPKAGRRSSARRRPRRCTRSCTTGRCSNAAAARSPTPCSGC